MINSELISLIRDKLKWTSLISFMLVMLFIGILINHFESYNFFEILAPVLLLMLGSTIGVLKVVLKNIYNFNISYGNMEIFKQSFDPLFNAESRGLISLFFAFMVFIYFICLYQLQFFNLNIMGCYTLFLGGGTFLFALIGYELHLRLTICLKNLEEQCRNGNLEYNINSPKDTPWLFALYQSSKLLRIASFMIGLLFVSENTLFFFSNTSGNIHTYVFSEFFQNLKSLPLELWVIWVFIFLTIAIALPIIALIQIQSLHNIVLYIEKDFNHKVMNNNKTFTIENSSDFLILLQTTHIVEKSLNETYLLQKSEKFIAISTSLLTCIIHILNFYNSIWISYQ